MRVALTFFFTFSFLILSNSTFAVELNPNKLKSIFIHRLTNYIQWPLDKSQKNFTILVYDDPPLHEELKNTMSGKTIQGLEVEVRQEVDVEKVGSAQIVVTGAKKREKVLPLLRKVKDLPVVTIGHMNGLLELGGIINFYEHRKHLYFEINKNISSKKDIKIHYYLSDVGMTKKEVTKFESLMLERALREEQKKKISKEPVMVSSQIPAITTVVTSEDIRKTGARFLHEVLSSTAGVFVGRSYLFDAPLFIIRGVSSFTNPQTLFLLNGGEYNGFMGNFPVKMIKRIEIIRGSGLAVHGTASVSGIINIVTKTKEDLDGTSVGATIGSFDTYQGWVLHGQSYKEVDAAFGVEFTTTNGHREIIDSDRQTIFDSTTSTSASHAPGPINNMSKSIHSHADAKFRNWSFKVHNKYFRDLGTGVGLAGALDPETLRAHSQTDLALSHEYLTYVKDLSYKTTLSYMIDSNSGDTPYMLFPPGSDPPPSGSPFPDGVIMELENNNSRVAFESTVTFKGIHSHIVQGGVFLSYSKLYDIFEKKNFDSTTLTPLPGGVSEITDPNERSLEDTSRTDYGAFIQDDWRLNEKWELSSGLRVNYISDFGETLNPRLSLGWKTSPELSTRFAYGRSFRAPTFTELFLKNNPGVVGNPDLEPEKVDNYQLEFDYLFQGAISLSLNVFQSHIKNLIDYRESPSGLQAINSEKLVSRGFELEAEFFSKERWKLTSNYSFVQIRGKDSKSYFGYAPKSKADFQAHWYFPFDYECAFRVNWSDKFKRSNFDSRPKLDGSLTADLTFHKKNLLPNSELVVSILNIFDKNYRLPSPFISNDLPQAGRSFYLGVQIRL